MRRPSSSDVVTLPKTTRLYPCVASFFFRDVCGRTGKRPPVPSRSFELHWDQRCESEWRWAFYCFATGQFRHPLLLSVNVFCTGIPTFMLNLALAGLIKFYEMQELGIAIVAIVFMAFLVYLRSCLIWAPHLLTKGSDLYRVCPSKPLAKCSLRFPLCAGYILLCSSGSAIRLASSADINRRSTRKRPRRNKQ